MDFSDPVAARMVQTDIRNQRKIAEATKKLTVNLMNPLREGKKLLVLDIDYSKLRSLCCTFEGRCMLMNASDPRHEAFALRCAAFRRMCSTTAS